MGKELVELSTAYATQTMGSSGKSEWVVYNSSKEEIYKLPVDWTEKQVMAAIHMGRKFELLALNKGAEFQKNKNPKTIKTLQTMVNILTKEKESLVKANTVLANELDKLTNNK